MSTIADLLIKVGVDTGTAEKDISSFGSKVGSGFKKALIPATAALGVMGVVGKAAFDNIQDGAKNAAQTEQVIKTTGGAANVTAKHVDDLSMSLRRKAGVDDDVVHSGANMLLTFTNVRNEVGKGNDIFDQATQTALDMSTALGTDIKGSAIQLGKALNDPIKGVSALQRVGVTFTEQQKEQIKTLVKSGDVLGAQKIVLNELGKEFGGAATHIDPMQRSIANLKLDSVDLASSLLSSLMPAIQVVVGILGKATSFMQEHETVTKIVVGVVAAMAVAVLAVNAGMAIYAASTTVASVATGAWTAAQWLLNAALSANPIALVILALVAIAAAIVVAYQKSETFRDIVNGAFAAIKTSVNAVKTVFDTLLGGIKAVVTWVENNWKTIAVLISGPFAPLVALATNAFGIRSALTTAFNGIKTFVSGIVDDIVGFFRNLPGRVVQFAENLGSGIVSAFRRGLSTFGGAITDLIKGPLNALIGAWNGLGIPGFNLHIGMPGPVPDINFGWGGMSLPDIPKLAIGTNMVNQDGLAFLHAGEAVVPADVAGGGFQGGGGTIVFQKGAIQVNGSVIHERDLEQVMQDALIRVGRRNGGNVFGGAVTT